LKKTNDGYAGSTVTHIRNVISGVLNGALDDETIPANPAMGLKGLVKKKPKNDAINPLTAEELTTLLSTVQEHYKEHYPLFLVLARTGMRIGEALALQWDDIKLKDRYIHIQRGLARGKISYPKSGKDRKVDMSQQLTETLKRLKGNFKLKVVDDKPEPEYIFKNTLGGLIDVNNWRRRIFKKALEKAKLRTIRIHDLRHTYASLRINKGDNIADVSNQLGHHSVKLTLDVYHHWIPGDKKAEVDALDDLSPMHSNAPHMHPVTSEKKKGAKQ
jgi:integrase